MKGKGGGEEVRRKGEKGVQGKGGEGPRIIYLYVHIFGSQIVLEFQHFGCFGPVVKHQKCNLKASKSTFESIKATSNQIWCFTNSFLRK